MNSLPTARTPRLAARAAGAFAATAMLTLGALPATLGGATAGAATAQAAPVQSSVQTNSAEPKHYIMIPGTCDPNGVNNYGNVDLRGGVKHVVSYQALGSPDCPGNMDASVAEGHNNAKAVIEQVHRDNPGARLVVVGYSQGAWAAERLLNDIADGRTSVPKELVEAKLYSSPMQPGTGLYSVVPKGQKVPLVGFGGVNATSDGPGRTDFGGIPFLRYCIETDGVCDMRDPFQAPGGFVAQHSCYPGHVFWTIADGVYSNQSHFWPRIGCGQFW